MKIRGVVTKGTIPQTVTYIKYENTIVGREQSKKYKQSIKVNGRPLEELLKLIGNEGIKRPRQLINKTKRYNSFLHCWFLCVLLKKN